MLKVEQVEEVVKDILPFAKNHKIAWRGTCFSYLFDLAQVTHELCIGENTTGIQLITTLTSLAEDYWVSSGMRYMNEPKQVELSFWQKLLQILRGKYERVKKPIRKLLSNRL